LYRLQGELQSAANALGVLVVSAITPAKKLLDQKIGGRKAVLTCNTDCLWQE
jgi:hypothetical protein